MNCSRREVALTADVGAGLAPAREGARPSPTFLLLALLIASGAVAQQPTLGLDAPRLTEAPAGPPVAGEALDLLTEEVASLMRCPACQGLSVADSPTESSQAIKREVRELLALGYSEDQVLGYFERSYGEFIRLAPKPKGFNLVVWLAPILGVLAGLWLVLTRIRASRPASTTEADAELDPYLERVREEARR